MSWQKLSNLFFSCPWLIECYWFHLITGSTSHQFSSNKFTISWSENACQTEKQTTLCWIRTNFLMYFGQNVPCSVVSRKLEMATQHTCQTLQNQLETILIYLLFHLFQIYTEPIIIYINSEN